MAFLLSIVKPLAYISLPIILLRSLATISPVVRYYTRVALFSGTVATVASCSFATAIGMALVGKRHDVNNLVARIFYSLTRKILNLHVVVEGEEHLNARPAVLMSNHQSMLDVVVLGRLMPKQTSIVSKKSLLYSPLGPFMSMSGSIFVDRGNNARAVQSLNEAGNLLKRLRTSIWMFPEGTRHMSETPDMLPLKKGGFHLAINAGIPIIPIVAENYWHIYHQGVFKEGAIRVRVLPPIPTTGLTSADVNILAKRVRDQMLEALREMSNVPEISDEKLEDTASHHSQSLDSNVPPLSTTSDAPAFDAASSSASLSSSSTIESRWKSGASENGAETEEDEGMILVGRPSN